MLWAATGFERQTAAAPDTLGNQRKRRLYFLYAAIAPAIADRLHSTSDECSDGEECEDPDEGEAEFTLLGFSRTKEMGSFSHVSLSEVKWDIDNKDTRARERERERFFDAMLRLASYASGVVLTFYLEPVADGLTQPTFVVPSNWKHLFQPLKRAKLTGARPLSDPSYSGKKPGQVLIDSVYGGYQKREGESLRRMPARDPDPSKLEKIRSKKRRQ